MKIFSCALLVALATAGELPYARSNGGAVRGNTICVDNDAGFVLDWKFTDLLTGSDSVSSDTYPIDQTRCMSLSESGIAAMQDNDVIQVEINAHAGET